MPSKTRYPLTPDGGSPVAVLEEIKPEFLEAGAMRMSEEDVRVVVEHADEVLVRISASEELRRYREDAELLMSLIEEFCWGEYREVPFWTVALITFTFLYVMKPIDIIPDTLPVIGQLDDAMVVAHCLEMVRPEVDSYRIWQFDRG